MRLDHESEQVSHRLQDLLEFKVHLRQMAMHPHMPLKAVHEELVGQHSREVFGDVDVQYSVEVLVFVILQLTEDGDLGSRVRVGVGGGRVKGRREGEGGRRVKRGR